MEVRPEAGLGNWEKAAFFPILSTLESCNALPTEIQSENSTCSDKIFAITELMLSSYAVSLDLSPNLYM